MFKHSCYNLHDGARYIGRQAPGVKLAEQIKKLVRRYLKVQGLRIAASLLPRDGG